MNTPWYMKYCRVLLYLKQPHLLAYTVMEYVFYYKILSLLSGLVIIFLGYLLFIKGIFNESGDFEGSFKENKIILKKAAPGTYFVLFGSIVILMALHEGFSTKDTTKSNNNAPAIHQPMNPLKDSIKIR